MASRTVCTVLNKFTGKQITVVVKTSGSGYVRPAGVMAAITENAKKELASRLKESIEDDNRTKLFSDEIMQKTHMLEITNPAYHASDHKDDHWDIDALDDKGDLIKNGHLTKEHGKQTTAK